MARVAEPQNRPPEKKPTKISTNPVAGNCSAKRHTNWQGTDLWFRRTILWLGDARHSRGRRQALE
jgi:hypothetical protein